MRHVFKHIRITAICYDHSIALIITVDEKTLLATSLGCLAILLRVKL